MSNLFKAKNIKHNDDVPTNNFSPKEIGFLLSMIEEMAISGKVLELAYSVKVKLQGKLNEIANKTEEF